MKVIMTILGLCLAASLLPANVLAKKVYSPNVKQGEIELETQSEIFRSKDPAKQGKGKHQLELSYGVTNYWHTGVYAVYEKLPGKSLDYTQAKWANIIQLTEPGQLWMDVGLYAEYIWAAPGVEHPDVLELKVLMEKPFEQWKHTLNLVFKQPLWGNETSTEVGYAWRSRYKMSDTLKPGIEVYGSLGTTNNFQPAKQSQLIGPVLEYKITDSIELDFGWLMDTHEGPAYGAFKLNMEFEF
jgi:hypothetical protein